MTCAFWEVLPHVTDIEHCTWFCSLIFVGYISVKALVRFCAGLCTQILPVFTSRRPVQANLHLLGHLAKTC